MNKATCFVVNIETERKAQPHSLFLVFSKEVEYGEGKKAHHRERG